MTESQALASVIATSYTMERLGDLTALLDSLERQTYARREIIIVLEKSRELLERIREYARINGYTDVRLLFNRGPGGAASARNLGVRHSRGEVLAFIDDDAVAAPGWLAEIVKTLEQYPDAIGVTGPILPLWENKKLEWLPEEFYWMVSCAPLRSAEPSEVRNAWGNNMSFKREAFEKGGLFLTELGARGGGTSGKHELTCEDTEFSMRARRASGKRIMCAPAAVVHHRAYAYRFRSGFVAGRAYWEGYTKVLLNKALGAQHADMLAVEHKLLRDILFKLVPDTLAGLLTHPAESWQKLKFITIALAGVSLGYMHGMFQNSGRIGREACIEHL